MLFNFQRLGTLRHRRLGNEQVMVYTTISLGLQILSMFPLTSGSYGALSIYSQACKPGHCLKHNKSCQPNIPRPSIHSKSFRYDEHQTISELAVLET